MLQYNANSKLHSIQYWSTTVQSELRISKGESDAPETLAMPAAKTVLDLPIPQRSGSIDTTLGWC
jgi:hypothetical protein